jgi:hypothetical protein
MSLINDALKKANEAPNAPPPPLPGSPLGCQTSPASTGLPLPMIIFSVLLCLILGLAAFFLVRGMKRGGASSSWRGSVHKASARERERKTFEAEIEKEAAASAAPRLKPQSQAAVAAVTPVATNPAAPVLATAPAVAATTNGFPALKVQGIFYRAKNPAAMINSKTVFVGERVSDAKVVSITADSVTVEFAGKTKVLSLY